MTKLCPIAILGKLPAFLNSISTSSPAFTSNSLRLNWTREEVDAKLKQIMSDIHQACIEYGKEEDGYVDYVKGANIAGFIKVADAMLAYGAI